MEIRIKNLKLKNFKGIKDLEINFEGQNANIYGRNATGKTTIFDAFKWLFFDKDSNDRKDFNIKTLDENNNAIHYLEHEVQAILSVDGQEMTFKKMLEEKWVKKRGQEQQEFSGHETSYWIDEVPIKKKDYEEKINSIISENLFKLITDPTFFNKMLWKEKRELLISISGSNITDNDILNSNEQFKILQENLQGRTIEDYKKVVQAKIKDLKEEKETIPVRIDELTQTLITEYNVNYDKLEEEKQTFNNQLKTIEAQMTDIQTRAEENIKKANQLAAAKVELNELKFKLETENSNKNSAEEIKLTNEKSVLEAKIRANQEELEERKLKVEQDTKKREELRKKWNEENEKKLEFNENDFKCPTCNREYEAEKAEKIKETFRENFSKHQESEKARINAEGQATNARLEENRSAVERLQNVIAEQEQQTSEIQKKLDELEAQKANQKPLDVTENTEYKEKLAKVEELQQEVDKLTSEDITELRVQKAKINTQIEDINKKLSERDTQEKTKVRIEELKKQEEDISQKIQELEAQQYQIEEFTKTKVELLENTINSNFEVVNFRLFKTQINGGLEECCDTLVNGVPYADVNNAHKILAGLDIINTLSRFYNATAPIFIDNRESINELYKTNAQVISLIVSEDNELRIEVQ